MPVLPVSDIVNVIVNLSPRSAIRSGFNIALFIGDSGVISPADRVKVYTDTDAMLTAGFDDSMPEYQAALLYFAANTNPGRFAVGRWDSANETLANAVTACRQANWDWYVLCLPLPTMTEPGDLSAVPAVPPAYNFTVDDIQAAAKYVEGCSPDSALFYATADIGLLEAMKGLNYNKSLGIYTEISPNISAALAGWAMGANTGLTGSAYALAYKTLAGVSVDKLDSGTIDAVKKANGNYYVNRGKQYDGFETGVMASGVWFDEIINLAMLSNDVQLGVMDLLNSARKVPQTEGGVLMIIANVTPAFERMRRIGFIAPGIWKAPPVMGLATGDAIPNGYLFQWEPVDDQPQSDRDARLAPPIYAAIKLAGAIQYVVFQIDVNR
ncbi:MAG: DUF3383 domain-containing protein [Oscillospiraceae bacterium]|nr:DUF3383 domain-containing protein [Oscillospiraceae bacterium]